mmetsp:Transcript_63411/g.143030  ORF Transcript_63411/g.143030 Transcript_63411/m.143030 type:complete len:416 (+) Transcript_63411:818-2065(+)
MGLGVGACSSTVPVYIAECAEPRNRGALATIPQLCISSGILLSFFVALGVTLSTDGAWRLMTGFALVPAFAHALCVAFLLPESPRWLLGRGGPDATAKARAALARLRGVSKTARPLGGGGTKAEEAAAAGEGGPLPAELELEFAGLVEGLAREEAAAAAGGGEGAGKGQSSEKTGFAAILTEPKLRRLALVCMGLQMFQQFAGINAIVYFTPQTLKQAGVPLLFQRFGLEDNAASLVATILAYLPKIPAIFLAMRLMDVLGRRKLLKTFIPGLAACLFTLSAVFTALTSPPPVGGLGAFVAQGLGAFAAWAPGALALLCICLYGMCFQLSLGPIPTILSSEVFPSRCRSAGMACSLGSQFFFNTMVGLAFPVLRHRFGSSAAFAVFGAVCLVAWAFCDRFVPETSGLALEELSSK